MIVQSMCSMCKPAVQDFCIDDDADDDATETMGLLPNALFSLQGVESSGLGYILTVRSRWGVVSELVLYLVLCEKSMVTMVTVVTILLSKRNIKFLML